MLLPKARNDWKNLRFMDYKSVDECNSVLFKTVSMLRLCGEVVTEEELLEKTFSTFHSSNIILQQQYRMKGFAIYTDLIPCLLLTEANNELLMKNSEARPVGSATLPEANEVEKKNPNECNYIQNDKRSHGKGRGGYRNVTITRTVKISTWPAGKETTITVVVVPIPAVVEAVMDEVEAVYPNRLTQPNPSVTDVG
ncbi:uncharacterized protein LOC106408443 [Brassica napus]|uniref:uncharacterized protein LOC106408443 n=1 Tax=Brassica napus TaxID=3708 RepID=UPI0006AB4C93|nr:uncharacterized protein LOC106408443 [Brassica napus]